MTCLGLKVFPISNLLTWTVNLWSKRLPKGKAPLSKPYGLSMPSPNCTFFGVQGLETLWCSKLDHLDSFGSSSVGRVFWAEMARLRFQVPDSCSICLSTMHWPEKTQCGHAFHLRCLLRHLDVSNTCPLCRTPDPLRAP
ncbi:hypothetical protein TNCV_1818321 [Trichonephila clavipes]|nr:hypothetical protein TNCV_1818321 [Trichonephila clavipes]